MLIDYATLIGNSWISHFMMFNLHEITRENEDNNNKKKIDYEKKRELCMQSGGLCSLLAIYINFACEEIYSEK